MNDNTDLIERAGDYVRWHANGPYMEIISELRGALIESDQTYRAKDMSGALLKELHDESSEFLRGLPKKAPVRKLVKKLLLVLDGALADRDKAIKEADRYLEKTELLEERNRNQAELLTGGQITNHWLPAGVVHERERQAAQRAWTEGRNDYRAFIETVLGGEIDSPVPSMPENRYIRKN